MIATILGAFRVAEIRKKIAFTALVLALYRLGTHIPAPEASTLRRFRRSPRSWAATASLVC